MRDHLEQELESIESEKDAAMAAARKMFETTTHQIDIDELMVAVGDALEDAYFHRTSALRDEIDGMIGQAQARQRAADVSAFHRSVL